MADGQSISKNIINEASLISNEAVKITRHILKLNKTKAKTSSSLTYLRECRKFGYIPKFIANATKTTNDWFHKNRHTRNKCDDTTNNYHQKLLNLHIDNYFDLNTTLNKKLNSAFKRLKLVSPPAIFKSIARQTYTHFQMLRDAFTLKKGNKSTTAKQFFFEKFGIKHNEQWFVNLTDIEFPLEIKWLLSLGGKFALPSKNDNFNLFTLIADVEDCINYIPDQDEREITRAMVANIILNYKNNSKQQSLLHRTINNIHQDTVKFLKTNKEIVILRADKGGATVAMPRSDYESKMNDIFSDTSKYTVINKKNPRVNLQTKAHELTKRLRNEGVISDEQRTRMTRYNTHISKVYGLPKVHKNPVKLRHIVSTVDSPSSDLAMWLDNLLKPFAKGKYDVTNSTIAAEKIKKIIITENEALTSFDVENLFPSVPLELAKEILMEFWPIIHEQTNISKQLLCDIFDFVTKDSAVFIWNDKFIKQNEGVFMGINTGPTIAALVMNKLLEKVISDLDFELKLLIKYVDDIFAVVPKDRIQHVLDRLNNFMPTHLKFTYEIEANNKLPFLDMLLKRDFSGPISIDWYQKPTAANKVLHFLSEHPIQQKMNVAFNMFYRTLSFVDKEFHKSCVEKAKNILLCNKYPPKLINKQFNKAISKLNKSQSFDSVLTVDSDSIVVNTEICAQSEKTMKCLPFINGLSQPISNVLKKQDTNIQLAYKPINQLRHSTFTNLKQQTKLLNKTNVVYKIPCAGKFDKNDQLIEKCDKCYVGHTKNHLCTRLNTHNNSVFSKNASSYTKTALANHCNTDETGARHKPNFDGVSVLETERRYYKRIMLENLHINNEHTYNTRCDEGDEISTTYCAILRICNKHNEKRRASNKTPITDIT